MDPENPQPGPSDDDRQTLLDNEQPPAGRPAPRSSIEADPNEEEREGRGVGFTPSHAQEAPSYRIRPNPDGDDVLSDDLYFRSEDWKFEHLSTAPSCVLLMLVNFFVMCTVFVLPILCLPHTETINVCPIQPFSILIYVHVLHWCAHLVMDQYLKASHKRKRLQGYTEFYLITKNVRRAPFYLVSMGNAIVLLTSTVLHDYCEGSGDCSANKFTNIDFLRGIITIECLSIMFMWFYYLRTVLHFNKERKKPDFMRTEIMRDWLIDLTHVPEDEEESYVTHNILGMVPESGNRVIEKHAELLRYMIAHVQKLNEKIIELTLRPPRSDDAQRDEEEARRAY